MTTAEIRSEISKTETILATLQAKNAPRQERIAALKAARRKQLIPALVGIGDSAKEDLRSLNAELDGLSREAEEYPEAIGQVNERLAQLSADLSRAEKEEHRNGVIATIKAAIASPEYARVENAARELREAIAAIAVNNALVARAIIGLSPELGTDHKCVINLDAEVKNVAAARLRKVLDIAGNEGAARYWDNINLEPHVVGRLTVALEDVEAVSL